jgi:hypothetical protein
MANEPTTAGPEILAGLPDAYMAAIGRVSAAWATLDLQIDLAIADVAQVPQFLGACITSQIFSTPSKLTALGGLMRAHGMPEHRVRWLNDFHDKTHALGRKRNRAVHDAIMIGGSTGTIYRMTATLDERREVAFGVSPSNFDELEKIFLEIKEHTIRFETFRREVVAELQALRQRVPLSFFQILPSLTPHVSEPLSGDNPHQRRSSPRKGRQKSK